MCFGELVGFQARLCKALSSGIFRPVRHFRHIVRSLKLFFFLACGAPPIYPHVPESKGVGLLRGTIVSRTYGIRRKTYILNHFHYYGGP